jgi:RecA/RadA recombinase
MIMSLMNKLQKNCTIKDAAILSKSTIFNQKDMITTAVPALNIALSGRLDGGLTSGVTTIAGVSKNFKTGFSLILAKAFLEKYTDGVVLFYDSEFGSPQAYFETFNIDLNKVLHVPITNIEELKFDIMRQLKSIEREDHVLIIVDSVGNLGSLHEIEIALEGKTTADLTRAKSLKSLFRMVTPQLTIKDIPLVVINHVYSTLELYSKAVVSGGCLTSGTKITLYDGSYKDVELFNVGDLVMTLQGPKEVTHVWNPDTLEDGEPQCFSIEFEDGFVVECSNKHKFYINNKWVCAQDIKVGDDVLSF